MAELVDALDLGSSGAIRGGSIPLIRTTPPTNDDAKHRDPEGHGTAILRHAGWSRAFLTTI